MGFSASNINEPNLGSALKTKVNRVVIDRTIPSPSNDSYTVMLYIPSGVQFDTVYYKTDSGTCDLDFKIDGVSIGAWSALGASSTEGNASASGSNTASAGQTLSLTVSNNTNGDMLAFTIVGQEV